MARTVGLIFPKKKEAPKKPQNEKGVSSKDTSLKGEKKDN